MKTYKTVDDYLKESSKGDKIFLSGYGILDGIKSSTSKHDVLTVKQNETYLSVRKYRGRTNFILGSSSYDQKVAVLTSEEYKKLPIIY